VTLRLLSYNVRFGGTGREGPLAAVIRAAQPDVVVLQEATDPVVVARLSESAGMPHWGARPGYSTGFLSRLPVAHHEWHRAPAARHPFLEVTLADHRCRVFGLHLSAWFSNWSERRRAREIRALMDAIRHEDRGFHVVAGDFNAMAPGERLHVGRMPAWIRAMVWLSGNDIARETIQVMLDEKYTDGWRHLHPDGEGHTFPTWDPHVRLDYIFAPTRWASRLASCEVFTAPAEAKGASDHYPLLMELADE
jgi:endonuclease/exonuclease/phosphatase family metal-dependent hydrolase